MTLLVVLEETGRSLFPSPLISTVIAAKAIERFGNVEQQARWLPGLADGSRIGTFALLEQSDDSARKVAETADLLVVLDESQLEEWCQDAIQQNEQAAEDVRNGKMAAIGRLVGHVMKLSKGSADAKAVQAKLRELLGS